MSRVRLPLILVGAVGLIFGLYLLLKSDREEPDETNRERLLPVVDRPSEPTFRPRLEPQATSEPLSSSIALPNHGGTDQGITEQLSQLEPSAAGWDSETASEAFGLQLKRIKAWVESGVGDESINDIALENLMATPLRPDGLRPMLKDAQMTVSRRSDPLSSDASATVLSSALKLFVGVNSKSRIEFKIIGIEPFEQSWRTRVLVEFLHEVEGQLEQRNATWDCGWSGTKLRKIVTLEYEEILLRTNTPLFEDATFSAMKEISSYPQQVLRNTDHYTSRLSKLDEMNLYGHHGLAIGDVNGDGLDDLYVCDGGGLPNRLYVQQPDGTLEDRSHNSKTNWLESSSSALMVDLDNDGDQDLVVATAPLLLIAENDGTGRFSLKGGHQAVSDALSITASDYDLDGDLDLYVCGYNDASQANRFGYRGLESATPIPYHDANNGGRNALLENRGEFEFIDVTDQRGLHQNNSRFSFSASWEDYDNDGDSDLYVANDFGRNNLYRNDDGMFRDIAAQAGVEDMAAGMSAAWGDSNRDGRLDLYVGNMFSAAGNRISYQQKFTKGNDAETVRGLQRMARGNTLFSNRSDGTFEDRSEAAGVTMGRWSWGSRFTDLNNDGWLDLVVANGFFTGSKPDDL